MSFCLHASSSSSFSSLACAHTRTGILHQTRLRRPRFVTMRFGSLVVPLHLVSLQRQQHTLFCPSRPFHVHLSLLRAHVLALPPFRAGWACGRRVCVCVQHFTGTVSNEATSEMGYPAWPAGCTGFYSIGRFSCLLQTGRVRRQTCLSVLFLFLPYWSDSSVSLEQEAPVPFPT